MEIFLTFSNIKRTAMVIRPKQPFINWLIAIDPDMDPHPIVDDDNDIYLLPDYEEIKQMEQWLKKNFDLIFIDQMNNWYTNESVWVKNRTFRLFKEWFDYSLHTMIFDTLDTLIEKI